MSVLLQPLRLMVYRRQSVIATASLQFLPAESRHTGAHTEVIQSLPSSDGDNLSVSVLGNKVDRTEREQRTRKDVIHQKAIEPTFIETKYGIRLEVADEEQGLISISETSLQDDPYVDLDVIKERYPTLSPYYQAWRQVYETEFEKQECHLGSGAEVFPDVDDRIAWDVEGFFLACWLALRSDVHSVEYIPRSMKYNIEKGTIESVLLEFLREIAKERRTVDQS